MGQSLDATDGELQRLTESVVERLGFELVDLELAGHRQRPILRLRIDKPESWPGAGVTVDDCARVSREVEAALDMRDDLSSSYILEVSSPGVERPLRKRRDFERSVGSEIAVRGFEALAPGTKRLEGVLLGIEGAGEGERLRIRTADGSEVDILRSAVAKANLVFKWDGPQSKKRRGRRS